MTCFSVPQPIRVFVPNQSLCDDVEVLLVLQHLQTLDHMRVVESCEQVHVRCGLRSGLLHYHGAGLGVGAQEAELQRGLVLHECHVTASVGGLGRERVVYKYLIHK